MRLSPETWMYIGIAVLLIGALILSRQPESPASRNRRHDDYVEREYWRVINEQYGGDEGAYQAAQAAWRARGGVFAPEIDHNE